MTFGDNVITQTQTQASALPGGFSSEEGLENLVLDAVGYARTIVLYP
jgi:hypothetical protein